MTPKTVKAFEALSLVIRYLREGRSVRTEYRSEGAHSTLKWKWADSADHTRAIR